MHRPGQENGNPVHASLMQLEVLWNWIWLSGELEFTLCWRDKTSFKTSLEGYHISFNDAAGRDIQPRNSPCFLEYQHG